MTGRGLRAPAGRSPRPGTRSANSARHEWLQSVVVEGCLRWGLIYQVVAVAYTHAEVLGRRHVLLVARPGAEWVLTRAGT